MCILILYYTTKIKRIYLKLTELQNLQIWIWFEFVLWTVRATTAILIMLLPGVLRITTQVTKVSDRYFPKFKDSFVQLLSACGRDRTSHRSSRLHSSEEQCVGGGGGPRKISWCLSNYWFYLGLICIFHSFLAFTNSIK